MEEYESRSGTGCVPGRSLRPRCPPHAANAPTLAHSLEPCRVRLSCRLDPGPLSWPACLSRCVCCIPYPLCLTCDSLQLHSCVRVA